MRLLFFAAALATGTALVSGALAALLIRLSRRFHLNARPRADRWHHHSTPNTGGMAILGGCAIVYAAGAWGRSPVIAMAAAGMALLGFLDDRVELTPLVKLSGQCVAIMAVLSHGVVLRATASEAANLALTFLWIAGITNAFNLIDNVDGLCSGVTVIICAFRFWSALEHGDTEGALLLAILAGGFLGFLFFNYKPAKIFLGDGGSLFAGFTLSTLAIAAPVPQTRVFLSAIFCPALTFLYPIFDTVLVSTLRRAAGRPISVGGRDHSSHRLASLGLSEQKVVWLLWALTAAGSAAGLLTYAMPLEALAAGAILAVGVTVFGVFLGTLPSFALPQTAPAQATSIRRLIPTLRAGIILIVEALLAGVALLAAFLVRWDGSLLGPPLRQFLLSLPAVMGCQALSCLGFRTFNLGWRWFGARDLLTLGESSVLGAALAMLAVAASGVRSYSGVVILLYVFLLFCFGVGLRVSMSLLWQTLAPAPAGRRAAVLGADPSGELLVTVLQRHSGMDACPVLILDTDWASDHTRIDGIPVRYAGRNLAGILRQYKVEILMLS
ncbi:MAG TPA: hypothetical protein VEU62_12390, partial [Bryobacterales bacterium]|nr:hypothetical protein [Bryobacterales bacterium]